MPDPDKPVSNNQLRVEENLDANASDSLVPSSVVPHGRLPALRYRDLPEPLPFYRMIGPGIILAGLSLGSGEFVIWPFITYKTQFVFFWACMLGVTTQYFLNMEITRWTLATGESTITGFCRLSGLFATVFLVLNLVPWVLPAWARGGAEIVGWLTYGDNFATDHSLKLMVMSALSLLLCGIVLTAGPVVYDTLERVQFFLVALVLILVILLACLLVRPDAVAAQLRGAVGFGLPNDEDLTVTFLLGAIAFAGAGGTLNLGQSNYIKDKGYGMGKYIGRITSPLTGQPEAISEIGYHFPDTAENRDRWRRWWYAAGWEHFFSFFLTCAVSLVLLTLICYSVFYDDQGALRPGSEQYSSGGFTFILGQANELANLRTFGPSLRIVFLVMGTAILFTTEIGVLDSVSRISTDIVKVNWLQENERWSESRLYFLFLWGIIALGIATLIGLWGQSVKTLSVFKATAAMNGGVMFLYSMILLYLNRAALPDYVRMNRWRQIVMVWVVVFYGAFSIWAVLELVLPESA